MLLIAFYILGLSIFAVAIVSAGMKVSKLRNTSGIYNARLLPFSYFSLSSWILGVLQYVILVSDPFVSFPNDFYVTTGLWLGLLQNVLWAGAVLSLHSKQFSRSLRTWSLFIVFPIVVAFALPTYRITVLTSESFIFIDAVAAAVTFTTFAYSIVQWRLSKISAGVFLVYGYSQWIWRFIWFIPLAGIQIDILLAFLLGRFALLVIWIKLVSVMVQRAQLSYEEVVGDINSLKLPASMNSIEVMISSTVGDLAYEKDAVEHAILGLNFTSVRVETLESPPRRPQAIKNSMATLCDIFILMIGERYGPIIKSVQKSVVEFEYEVAHAQNPGKILVYVKDGVNREPQLEKFLKCVRGSKHVYFTTPEDLYGKVQGDIANWLTSYAKQ